MPIEWAKVDEEGRVLVVRSQGENRAQTHTRRYPSPSLEIRRITEAGLVPVVTSIDTYMVGGK